MNELLQEFFYDGISRIIPGLVTIGFYGRNIVMLGDFKDASVTLSICLFLAAWLIGAIVEILTISLPKFLLYLLKDWFSLSKLVSPVESWLFPSYDFEVGKPPPTEREKRKLFAEATMFRCLLVISVVNYFAKPDFFWSIRWTQCDSIFGAIVFMVAWVWLKTIYPLKKAPQKD